MDAAELGGHVPDLKMPCRRPVPPQEIGLGEIRDPVAERPRLLGRDAEGPGRLVEGGPGAVAFQAADEGPARPLALAVFFQDVAEDVVALAGVEIQVDVRRVAPAAVEEPLEVEVELDRADVGDAQEIRQVGRRARALEVVEDAVAPGEVDDVVDDEEVGRETGGLDDVELAAGPLPLAPAQAGGVPEAFQDELAQGPRENVRGERRHDVLEGEAAFLGGLERPLKGFPGGGAELLEGERLLVGAEEADRRRQPVLLRRKGDFLADGADQGQAVGALDEFERVGPDDGETAGLRPLRHPAEVGKIAAQVEILSREIVHVASPVDRCLAARNWNETGRYGEVRREIDVLGLGDENRDQASGR